MKRKVLAAACLLLCVLCACGKEAITKEEIENVLPTLVEKAAVLNGIYFGEGFFPKADMPEPEHTGYYYADSQRLGFADIRSIREATEAVFTPEYAALLYTNAFDGIEFGEASVLPRYIEDEMGILQSMHGEVYRIPERVFLYETLALTESSADRAIVSVETVADGESVTLELIVVRTESADGYVYRLDSPTY